MRIYTNQVAFQFKDYARYKYDIYLNNSQQNKPRLNFFEILGDFFEKSLEYYLGLDNSIAAIHFVNNLTQVNED